MKSSRSGDHGAGSSARRRVGRALAALVAAIAVATVVTSGFLLHQLDAPWLRSRLVSIVRSRSGLEVDYRFLRLHPLSGVEMEGLLVRTPPALRDVAPDLARVGRLEVTWSPASLLGLGRGSRIERVTLADVSVMLASDERGHGSLDSVAPSPRPPRQQPAATFRLSHAAAELLSSVPPVGHVEVSGLAVTLARVRDGRIADRFGVRGLSMRGEVVRAGTAFHLRATAGSLAAPLLLEVTRDGGDVRAGTARLDASAVVDVSPTDAALSLGVRVREQTLAPRFAVRELLHVDASAKFDPAHARTDLLVSRVSAGDGAAALEGHVQLLDGPGATPLVQHARGDVDLERLLRMAPDGLVPVQLGRGEVHWRAEDVEIGTRLLVTGGSLVLDADVVNLRVSLPNGALSAGSAHLAIRGLPGPGGQAALRVQGLRLAAGRRRVIAEGVEARMEATRRSDGALSGTLRLALAALDLSGAGTLVLRQGRLEARTAALRLVTATPLASTGDVELSGHVASMAARSRSGAVMAERVRWAVGVPLAGGAPLSARVVIPADRLRILGSDARPIADGPARIELRVSQLVPDLDRPAATRGVADVSAALGASQASLHVAKEGDTVELDLHASAPEIASIRTGRGTATEPWERISFVLSTRAHVERALSSNPRIEQSTNVQLGRPAWAGLSADGLSLDVRSSGDAVHHQGEADLRLRALRAAGGLTADEHATLSAQVDLGRPSVEFHLVADGASAGSLTGSLRFDRDRSALRCDLDGALQRMAPLARLAAAVLRRRDDAISGVELEQLGIAVHLDVLGLLASGTDGVPRPASDPLRTLAAIGTIDLRAGGLSWRVPQRTVTIPSARWHATLGMNGSRRTLESIAEVDEVHVAAGAHRVDAAGLVDRISASVTGDVATGEVEVDQHMQVASLLQDVGAYPFENACITLRARRDRDGVLHVSELRLENEAGGTTLAAHGIVDSAGLRRRLSFSALLEQDVARAWSKPAAFAGTGHVTVAVQVDSPDLTLFRTISAVRFDDVHARLRNAGVAVEALDGEIPIVADVAVRAGRVIVLRRSDVSHYPTLRFVDQHPLMSHTSFVSAASIDTPDLHVAPLAGNLAVEHNVVSVSQLEMGVRGGKITGACVLDWDGPRTTLEARVRATGVLSSRGEPFDGNAALLVSAADRSVAGRAEILRIGRRHLLDLLDLEDPHRTSAAANRVRHALALGYPDRVRITFDHGFASARVTFGGLARLVQVDELRGIPTGPLVDKLLAPLSRDGEEP